MLGVKAPVDPGADDRSMSAVQIASKYGFLSTLESLFDDYRCKVSLEKCENSAAVLAVRSGNDRAAIRVYEELMRETAEAFHALASKRASRLGDNGSDDGIADSDDNAYGGQWDRLVGNAKKITGEALLAKVEIRGMQLDTFDFLLSYLRDPSKVKDAQGHTPLLLAARVGAIDLVERLHVPGTAAEADDQERTALHYACHYGHWPVVQFLVQAEGVEYSLTAQDAESATPVIAAAMGGYPKIVELLLPRLSAEDLRTEFILASRKGLVSAMELILKAAAKVDPSTRRECLQTRHGDFGTRLQHAVMNGQPRVVHFLLLRQPNVDEVSSRDSTTPLARASQKSDIESMRLLLDAGASTEVPTRRGRSILSEAIFCERPDAVRLLLDYGASTQLPPYWGHYDNLLVFTLSISSPAVLRVLLQYFEKVRENIKVGPIAEEITPTEILRRVIRSENLDMYAAMKQAWRRDVFDSTMRDARIEVGRLFENTAFRGAADTLRQVYEDVDGQIDVDDTKGFYGTALEAAAASRRDALAKVNMLLGWEAKPDPWVGKGATTGEPGQVSADGSEAAGIHSLLGYWGTALHAAVFSRNRDVAAALVSVKDGLKDTTDLMGRLPLHLAAITGDLELVQQLSTEKSTPASEDHQGRNALHMACRRGETRLVEELLSSAEDVSQLINRPDTDGWTPLHWACRSKVSDLVELLLTRGACPDKATTSPLGWLPYHVAVHHNWEAKVPQTLKEAYYNNHGIVENLPKATEGSLQGCECCRCVS
jgi:ankyrin repeat protein